MVIGVDMAVRKALQSNTDSIVGVTNRAPRKGMVLPFQPLSLAFNHVNYYVHMPAVSCSFKPVYYYYLLLSFDLSSFPVFEI